jgi:hypothetical protein
MLLPGMFGSFNGSRECAPDDRLRVAIRSYKARIGLLRRYASRNDDKWINYGFKISFCTRQFNSSAT